MPRHTPVLDDTAWPNERPQVRSRSQVVQAVPISRWVLMLAALSALLFV